MREVLSAFGPMLLFMFIPVWIPVVAVTCGHVYDALTRKPSHVPVDQRVRNRAAVSSEPVGSTS